MKWIFPLNPVAASRPRVSKWGTYFSGPYKDFRNEVVAVIHSTLGEWTPTASPIKVKVGVYPIKPRTSKLEYPRPDVDNYAKAVLDSCNEKVWVDDSQIVELIVTKRWSDAEGYFTLEIKEL